jgi:hypothetical protein
MVVNSNWICKSITDHKFKTVIDAVGTFNISQGPWIAGGCVRKLWQGIEWREEDIDLFFSNKDQFDRFIATTKPKKSFINPFNNVHSLPNPKTGKCGFHIQHESDNAKTFTVEVDGTNGNNSFKVQAICRWFPESSEVLINDFDWTVCQFISDSRHMWATPAAIEGINSNQIILSPSSTREIKALRLIKYLAYGFVADDEMVLNMMKRLEDNPIKDNELSDDY